MPATISCEFEFGDIVLVPFPFTDQTAIKKRPAVVVSSNAYHRDRPDLILMAVTSQVRPATGIGEIAVQRWKEAGLLMPSVLKPLLANHRERPTTARPWAGHCAPSWASSRTSRLRPRLRRHRRCESCGVGIGAPWLSRAAGHHVPRNSPTSQRYYS